MRERVGAMGPELLVQVVTPGRPDRDSRPAPGSTVLRLDRRAREDFDRRRVAMPHQRNTSPTRHRGFSTMRLRPTRCVGLRRSGFAAFRGLERQT